MKIASNTLFDIPIEETPIVVSTESLDIEHNIELEDSHETIEECHSCESNETFISKTYDENGTLQAQVYILGFCDSKHTTEIIMLLETCKENDIVTFHLDSCYFMEPLSLMSSIEACKGNVATYGHSLEYLDAIVLWAVGHERYVMDYSRFSIAQIRSGTYGKVQTLKETTQEIERINNLYVDKLVSIGLISDEEYDTVKKTKSSLLLFGDDLKQRVD